MLLPLLHRLMLVTLLVLTSGLISPSIQAAPFEVPAPTAQSLKKAINSEPKQALALAENFMKKAPKEPGEQGRNKAIAQLLIGLAQRDLRDKQQALDSINHAITLAQQASAPLVEAQALYHRGLLLGIHFGKFDNTVSDLLKTLEQLNEQLDAQGINASREHQQLAFNSHNKLASLYFFLKTVDAAGPHLQQADRLAKIMDNRRDQIQIALLQAKYSQHQLRTKETEVHLLNASQWIREIDDPEMEGEVLLQISKFYRHNKQHEMALKYTNEAVELFQHHEMTNNLFVALNDLGIIYQSLDDDNMALISYLNALKLSEESHGSVHTALTQHNIGEIYHKQQQLELAAEYLLKANVIFKEAHNRYFYLANAYALADLMLDQNAYAQASKYGQTALELAKELDNTEHLFLCHKLLATLAVAQQQLDLAAEHYQKSLEWQEKYLAHEEEQQSSGDQLKLQALQQQFSAIEQQYRATQQQLEHSSQQLDIAKLVGIGAVLLSGLGLFFWRRLHQQYRRLEQLNTQHELTTLPALRRRGLADNTTTRLIDLPEESSQPLLLLFDWPMFTALPQRYGINKGAALQRQWLDNLLQSDNGTTFSHLQQLSDSLFLLPCPRSNNEDKGLRVDTILAQLHHAQPSILPPTILPPTTLSATADVPTTAVAIIDYHFLPDTQVTISDSQRLELLHLAHWGASWLTRQHHTDSWVYLKAKPNLNAAIFFGTDSQPGLSALNNRFFEIHTNAPGLTIPWPVPER